MNAQQLKNSILQEAIEGRLVPQDPNDEPASVLLEKIRKEKARLVKEKKIKADKNESYIYRSEDGHWMEHFADKKRGEVCIDGEIPYQVPSGWGWCRIDEYASKVTDFVASGSFASLRENVKYYSNKEYAILVRTKDFQTRFQSELVYTDKHGYEFLSNSNLFGGELILPNIGASIGKVFIVPALNYRMTLAPNTIMVRFYWDYQRDWIYTIFCSGFGKDLLHDISSSTAQGKFNKTDFKKLLIPIPPLAEQHRIVAKIEELLPKVEEYGKAQEALDKLNEELPERLKKSILQEAIEGRLVPQDPNDEPASVLLEKIRKEKARLVKEGKLKKKDLVEIPIEEDEKPFEIPESWEWTHLGNVISLLSGRDLTPEDYNDTNEGIPYITGASNFEQGSLLINRWTPKPVTISKFGDLLITCKGTIGTMAFNVVGNIHIARQVMAISPYMIDIKFIKYFLMRIVYELDKKAKSIIPGISREDLLTAAFPLPPLSEQHRIVAKIEQLMKEIDKLKG